MKKFVVSSIVILAIFMFMIIIENQTVEPEIGSGEKASDLSGTSFEMLDIPLAYDLRQFEGMSLNFIVENNLYANILLHESEEFSEVTGIDVNIKAVDYETMVQKLNLDFIAKEGRYQIVYVDPYQTLNRFYDYLEPLENYEKDPVQPHVDGFEDFYKNQLEVVSKFGSDQHIYSVPLDSTTMILYYRKDVFETYRDTFFEEMGYDWLPGGEDFTWDRYIEISKWINENVPDDVVTYGSGHMAQEHNSIYCDFSNVLASYGGDYFLDDDINTVGVGNYREINVQSSEFTKALDTYKRIIDVSAPDSVNWNWSDSAEAFRTGKIAMMPNWDENATYIEGTKDVRVSGNVGYALLPYGSVRSANIYGGSGIGINRYASEEEKEAAWLYVVWATSREMQLEVFRHPEGGCLPNRASVYEMDEMKGAIERTESEHQHTLTVLNAWKEENLYLRPKVSDFYYAEQILISRLHQMIEQDLLPGNVSRLMYNDLFDHMMDGLEEEVPIEEN